jgi:hypothetical protein
MLKGLLLRCVAFLWCRRMRRGDDDHRRVLANLLADRCSTMLNYLRFAARLSLHNDRTARESWLRAQEVVRNASVLRCAGRIIQATSMPILARTERTQYFLSRLDDDGVSAAASLGLDTRAIEIHGNPLLSRLLLAAKFRLRLGNALGICWVFDHLAASPVSNGDSLCRRLGIMPGVDSRVLITYDAGELSSTTLRVPRALDAIDQPLFLACADCEAPTGTTRPLPPEMTGLPEAVHPAKPITPMSLVLLP